MKIGAYNVHRDLLEYNLATLCLGKGTEKCMLVNEDVKTCS